MKCKHCKQEIKTPTESERKRAKILADHLEICFTWTNTQEGAEYWQEVYDKLIRIESGEY